MSKLGEIFNIPDAVHQGDFVLRLSEGLQQDRRQTTLKQYVVTPQLVECFDQALSLVGSAVSANSSKGAYLHGSFGSGKSHFMAVLDLILEGDPAARSIPELAATVSKNNHWREGPKIPAVPLHMIGAESMEEAILGGYAKFVRARHPEAPVPGFYRSQSLLRNAENLRRRMGDEAFFAELSSDSGGSGGWGDFEGGWDAERYEAAAAQPPEHEEHQALVSDLIHALFPDTHGSATSQSYLDLDRGLAVMSQHAQALGYTAVVLFLDELILWLASHSADQVFLNREGQKVAKLVEAGDANRPIPIVSFIARQRDLKELVGDSVPGAQQLAFSDVLQWWEARFAKIVMEDRNLPAIIKKRLLTPKDEAAKQTLDQSFEQTARVRQEVLDILLTREGDKQMFRQVYPFSPALVQTLVAISNLLQRERTALKLMLQLLVYNRDRLEVGDVIPVGELFDVIIEDGETFTPQIKRLFDRARSLWRTRFLPLLEEELGVEEAAVKRGEADQAKAVLFRSQAGLLKTLLLSALAPEVEALRNLTAQRLAALNHGTIKAPIPNAEHATVLNLMKKWAGHASEIQISPDGSNPTISLHLTGVDIEGIVENASSEDTFGNRVRLVKELLFRDWDMDMQQSTTVPTYKFQWRGTARTAEVLYTNVRELNLESFKPSLPGWRVVIDFPFDEQGDKTPADDRAKVQEYRLSSQPSTRTVVWLPSFLNERALGELKRLIILNHILKGSNLDTHASHLQPGERSEARSILRNQRDTLEKRVVAALFQAYGLAQGNRDDDAVDTTHSLNEHFESLHHGLSLQPPPGGSFRASLESLLDQALSCEFPAHPKFDGEVKKVTIKHVWDTVREAIDTPDGRIGMQGNVRDEMRRVVVPLKLGACGEGHFIIGDHWRTHFDRKCAQHEVDAPSVEQLRQWCDEPTPMGLPEPVSDLLILTYAAQSGRSFHLHGATIAPTIGGLNRECVLRTQDLPAPEDWKTAVDRASQILGLAVPASLQASNVSQLNEKVAALAAEKRPLMTKLLNALEERLSEFDVDPSCDRLKTAKACDALLSTLGDGEPVQATATLAGATVETSAAAMGTVTGKLPELVTALQSSEWKVMGVARQSTVQSEAAEAVVSAIQEMLRSDEHVIALKRTLNEQHSAALELLAPPKRSDDPPPEPPATDPGDVDLPDIETPTGDPAKSKRASHTALTPAAAQSVLAEIREALAADQRLRVDIEYRLFDPDASDASHD